VRVQRQSVDSERVCPLCGAEDLPQWRFGLRRCVGCGLKVSPAVWSVNANETFEEEWFGEDYEVARSLWVRLFEQLNNKRTLRHLAFNHGGGGHLLEIGVGSGSLLQDARNAGFQVTGCDLSRPICESVSRKLGVPVHCGAVSELPRSARFDVVVMNHILEHVADPVGLLREVRNRLSPGGVLHVAVPNIACLSAVLPGWASYEPYHLTYFSSSTLRMALTRAGFTVERELSYESFSGWFLAGVRTVLRGGRCLAVAGDANKRRRIVGGALRGSSFVEHAYRLCMVISGVLSWPVRRLQGILGKGDELICIAKAARA